MKVGVFKKASKVICALGAAALMTGCVVKPTTAPDTSFQNAGDNKIVKVTVWSTGVEQKINVVTANGDFYTVTVTGQHALIEASLMDHKVVVRASYDAAPSKKMMKHLVRGVKIDDKDIVAFGGAVKPSPQVLLSGAYLFGYTGQMAVAYFYHDNPATLQTTRPLPPGWIPRSMGAEEYYRAHETPIPGS